MREIVTRFEPKINNDRGSSGELVDVANMETDKQGRYVTFEDYEQLRKELEYQKKRAKYWKFKNQFPDGNIKCDASEIDIY